jgi:hypothetical protein
MSPRRVESDIRILKPSEIRLSSGFTFASHRTIRPVRQGFFVRDSAAVAGDAPKDFIRVYEYGRGRKSNPATWPAHIAKVGHKYYPNESVTEHLLTRIGELLALDMARSRLMWVRGQLRFLSEYFLRPEESLVHGAQIFAGYLNDDSKFVEQVEEMKMSNEIFTFQVAEAAIRNRFPAHAEAILRDLVRLIGFDAIVGNNDRHFFNWGVITHVAEARPPRFSPIYDTARALLWNMSEATLTKHLHERDEFLKRYSRNSLPKMGWDGCKSLSHFEFVLRLFEERPNYRDTLKSLHVENLAEQVDNLFGTEFADLMSPLRKGFILDCLRIRLGNFKDIATL